MHARKYCNVAHRVTCAGLGHFHWRRTQPAELMHPPHTQDTQSHQVTGKRLEMPLYSTIITHARLALHFSWSWTSWELFLHEKLHMTEIAHQPICGHKKHHQVATRMLLNIRHISIHVFMPFGAGFMRIEPHGVHFRVFRKHLRKRHLHEDSQRSTARCSSHCTPSHSSSCRPLEYLKTFGNSSHRKITCSPRSLGA